MDGRKSAKYFWFPKASLYCQLLQKGIILTKEYRHNHGWAYGVPMGRMEVNDSSPLDAAKREILEEVGLSATKWTLISTHHNGIHEEGLNYYFVAEGLSSGEHKHDADEDIEKVEMTFENAFQLMDEGRIVDLRSRGCIWAGYIHLLRRNKKDSNNTEKCL